MSLLAHIPPLNIYKYTDAINRVSALGERLEVRFAGVGIEQVNIVAVDIKLDRIADAHFRTWIERGYGFMVASRDVYLKLAAQVLDYLYRRVD